MAGSAGGRKWKLLIGFALTAGFVGLLVHGLDPVELRHAFAGLSVPAVLLSLVFLAVGYTVRIVRWWCLLRVLEPNLPFGACIWPFLASIAVNNVLPLRAGDVLRAVGFRRQLRSPAVRVAGTLVIERAMDLVVLSGIFFLGLLALPDPHVGRTGGVLPSDFVVAVTWLSGLSVAGILALMLFLPWLERIRDRLPGSRFVAGRRWPEAVARHVAHLVEALGLLRSPQRVLALLGLSVVSWICEGAVFVTVATALHTGTAPLGPWLSLATGTLATLLPSAPGYIGTFDYFAAQGLAAYGVSPETAAAFALIVHAVLWAPLTALGALYLLVLRGRSQDVRHGL